MQRCSRCHSLKPATLGCFQKSRKGELLKVCRKCSLGTKKYRHANQEKVNQYHKQYCIENKAKISANKKRYYKGNKKEIDGKRKKYIQRIVSLVLTHYGGKCYECGETRTEFLSIDHLNGGGRKHREQINRRGNAFSAWLVQNNYPSGYGVLCYNCQSKDRAKRREQNQLQTKSAIRKRTNRRSIKQEFFDHFGRQCVICGETDTNILECDHPNKDGEQHRGEVSNGMSGSFFFRCLQKKGWESTRKIRVLCANCNQATSDYSEQYIKGIHNARL